MTSMTRATRLPGMIRLGSQTRIARQLRLTSKSSADRNTRLNRTVKLYRANTMER